ncbi:MAG: hypothetical protein LBV20_05900 [Treponema sp.]|jgi:WD40 repeat protein|nr:hypothetical protein [Treponema sp.]
MIAKISCKKVFIGALIIFHTVIIAGADSFETIPADAHTGTITSLVQAENGTILSAGEDGFINIWNIQKNVAESHLQVSSYPVIAMTQRPGRPHIAVIESDEMGLYRISAWDYNQRKKLFTLRFKDPLSFITYSKNGSFLIAARIGRTGIVFINPENGELLQAPSDLNGTITFAATGKSERTMIAYSPSGTLSYWNLESGKLMQSAVVPQDMKFPLLLNNNLFFAGIDKNGLVVLDALSGKELSRNNSIKDGQLLSVSDEGRNLVFVQTQNGNNRYLLLRIENNGTLRRINQKIIPANNLSITSSILLENHIALGTEDGKIHLYQHQKNTIKEMETGRQFAINEIASSENALALLHNEKGIAFIPSDVNVISAETIIRFEDIVDYDQIISADRGSNSNEYFVLWRSADTKILPIIRNKNTIISAVEELSDRFPLRMASVLNKHILFLDTGGNISIYNIDTKTVEYRHSVAGALHASFIDEKNIIVSRIADTGNTPFLMLNTSSGETVPLAYPAELGTRVFRNKSGILYAAVVNQDEDEFITRIINLNTSNPTKSQSLVEYMGEDIAFSVAESGGNLATTLGGDGASLFTQRGSQAFERSAGLPVKLINTKNFFTILDNSGNITWHNSSTGNIEATLGLYDKMWRLQKRNGDILEGVIQ